MTMYVCKQCGVLVTKSGCMVEGSDTVFRCERLEDAKSLPKPERNPDLEAFLASKEQKE